MKVQVRFKRGLETVVIVEGQTDIKSSDLVFQEIISIEQNLEKLTGLRVHIESKSSGDKSIEDKTVRG